MHDMWCLTGICHHSLGCRHYESRCGDCPFLRRPLRGPHDLSHRIWKRKRQLYESASIHFVAVSRWLGDLASRSSLLRHMPLSVIPNPHIITDFTPGGADSDVIAFCAARLDDPIKGLELATEVFNRLADEGIRATVELAGEIRDKRRLDDIRLPHKWHGQLGSEDMRALLTRAKVVLNSSHYENLPNILIEGLASGAVPVAFDHGGQSDIISHLTNGYLARYPDVDDLARGLRWALKAELSPHALHADAEARFSAPAIAARLLSLLQTD
ncbi:MAG: glycosyltransferase, partial [Muribaculaceae bacterium]|nr:glycosyltransferase [Muribaculaceae bacterium]